MKIGIISKTALFCAALLGFSAPCPASDVPAGTTDSALTARQEEAIIVSIDRNKVTLQSVADTGNITTITADDATGLKVGDKVRVNGTKLTKLGQGTNGTVTTPGSPSATPPSS